jgi:hypothetical protein
MDKKGEIMTTRTFQVRMRAVDKVGLAVMAVLMVALFWQMMPWLGLMCAVLTVIQIERIIHSTYVLTAQGTLHLVKGRFIRTQVMGLDEIRAVSVHVRHVELELASGKHLLLYPLQPEAFAKALDQRLHPAEEADEAD